MKVALLIPNEVDRSGLHRVTPCLSALVSRLTRMHEVHIVVLRPAPATCEYETAGARVHNIAAPPRRLRAIATIRREHRREPFDVLHAVQARQGAIAAAAGLLLRRPVVLHLAGDDLADVREIDYGLARTWRGRTLLRWAVGGADHVTVPSESMRTRAAELGIEAERMSYGVALGRWPPRPPQRRRPHRPARLLHVGDHVPVKDQTTMLRAAARLVDAGIEFLLDVVGEDRMDGEMRRLAGSLGLTDDRVRFHGFVPHDRLRPYFDRADLLLVSSYAEAGPTVVIEAAIAGVPTVGTAVGLIADWTPDSACAVPVGDDYALAQATMSLLADEDLRIGIAMGAQVKALAMDTDTVVRRMRRIYGELAETHARREGWRERPPYPDDGEPSARSRVGHPPFPA